VNIASRFGGGSATNPVASNPRAVQTGRDAYTGSCAQCHGATGDGKGEFGQATFPPATDLTSNDTRKMSDAQLFWIVKNGLGFTAMPGYASQYDDQQLWSLVSYVRALQNGQRGGQASVPQVTLQEISVADPASSSAAGRGAAVYFAQGCDTCHGATGNAAGRLGLGPEGRQAQQAVRSGRPGMPAYGPNQISDAQLQDLAAYISTFQNGRRGGRD
ncbi:MAG: c-type cytochrome, partial [Chloroflexi bacterium]|nr:c-type cytochrome [Chloroflexota bacterium]